MNYLKKLLERYTLKEATRIAYDRCPGDFFKDAPDTENRCHGGKSGPESCHCGSCWQKDAGDAAWKEKEGAKRA